MQLCWFWQENLLNLHKFSRKLHENWRQTAIHDVHAAGGNFRKNIAAYAVTPPLPSYFFFLGPPGRISMPNLVQGITWYPAFDQKYCFWENRRSDVSFLSRRVDVEIFVSVRYLWLPKLKMRQILYWQKAREGYLPRQHHPFWLPRTGGAEQDQAWWKTGPADYQRGILLSYHTVTGQKANCGFNELPAREKGLEALWDRFHRWSLIYENIN